MKTPRRSFPALAALAFLGALLATSPALADRAQCESTCATKGGESLQACMDRCPAPAMPSKSGAGARFQSCAQRCAQKYEQTFKTCSSRCPKTGPSGKEKAATLPSDES
jgi:epoxyqueuosine reductase QueG